jgi:hypothetical protein
LSAATINPELENADMAFIACDEKYFPSVIGGFISRRYRSDHGRRLTAFWLSCGATVARDIYKG